MLVNYNKIFKQWQKNATADASLALELNALSDPWDADEIVDRFYCDLVFGTGGLRGLIGAGTNRMNLYTVRKATQGLANYLLSSGLPRQVAIAYDSRIKSDFFARTAAEVLAANGVTVHIFPQLMPTPALSYAVRALSCAAGVCITASHNPARYNGYKVYGPDGCQITNEAAEAIGGEIEKVDPFTNVEWMDYEEGLAGERIRLIGQEVTAGYLDTVLALRTSKALADNLNVVYTPFNGAGLSCVRTALEAMGVGALHVVPEQEEPDGNFPTCPYPNPEKPEAMALGLALASQKDADLLLATDPDCDRVGVAVKTRTGYRLLSGNEVGVLMLDYLCRARIAQGTMPASPVAIKTVVTTDMARLIAKHYGVELCETLTGFKYIGEQISELEACGRVEDYILGFEESYGYLTGTHVRDKDGVNAAVVICEMAAAAKRNGTSLQSELDALYDRYGYHLASLLDFAFEGERGMWEMLEVMGSLRNGLPGVVVEGVYDYQSKAGTGRQPESVGTLPAANVLEFALAGGDKLIVRPSGTEPKMKMYLSVCAKTRAKAEQRLCALEAFANSLVPLEKGGVQG